MQPRAFSLRDVPPIIYVAIGLSLGTTLLYVLATAAKGIHELGLENYREMATWRTADQTANEAYSVLFPLGLLALARRQTGPGRALTIVGAALGFVGLSYIVMNLVFVVARPDSDLRDIYDAMGYLTGLAQIAGAVLLTIGARAWTRVPVAAVFLFVLIGTSYWVPGIGHWIYDQIGRDMVIRSAYGFVRECGWAACNLFIAAAIAAQCHQTPEPPRAAMGFRIARGALLARLYVAIALVFALLMSGQSHGAGTVFLVATPLVALATMMIFAIALVRVSTSGLEGLSRWRFAIGAGVIVWWTFLQLYVAGEAYSAATDYGSLDDLDQLGSLAIIGPIAVALALGLIGSGTAAMALLRGDQATASRLTARTIAVVVLSLGAIALQAFALDARTPGTAIAVMLVSMGAGLAALILLAGILRIAADVVGPAQLPPARLV